MKIIIVTCMTVLYIITDLYTYSSADPNPNKYRVSYFINITVVTIYPHCSNDIAELYLGYIKIQQTESDAYHWLGAFSLIISTWMQRWTSHFIGQWYCFLLSGICSQRGSDRSTIISNFIATFWSMRGFQRICMKLNIDNLWTSCSDFTSMMKNRIYGSYNPAPLWSECNKIGFFQPSNCEIWAKEEVPTSDI